METPDATPSSPGWTADGRIPGGNAAGLKIIPGDCPEIRFTPAPRGTRPLWFCFQVKPPPAAGPGNGKLRLVLEHYDTLAGARDPAECCPVF